MMEDQPKNEYWLAEDFLADEAFVRAAQRPSSEAYAQWEAWAGQHPKRSAAFQEAVRWLSHLESSQTTRLSDTEKVHLFAKIQDRRAQRGQKPPVWHWPLRAVAAVAMICLVWMGTRHEGLFDAPAQAVGKVAMIEKYTPAGVKTSIKFADGTVVKLNANSIFRYPEQFGEQERRVYLEGEAYFDVAHDPSRPFIVESGKAVTRVLGTSFLIKAYPTDNIQQVAVVSGKVSVTASEGGQGLLLTANEMATVSGEGKQVRKSGYSYKAMIGWKDGLLAWEGADLPAIVEDLQNWYGYRFVVKINKKTGFSYSGEYQNMALKDVLNGIGFVCGFSYEINHSSKTVTLIDE